MEIKTLKDLKIALKNTPNKVLENFGVGFSEEPYVELMVWGDEEEFGTMWEDGKKKCPAIDDINNWIKNISKVAQELEKDGSYEGVGFEDAISSEDFKVEDKKSSPIQELNLKETPSIPPNLKRIGYPKNTIYMKTPNEIKKELERLHTKSLNKEYITFGEFKRFVESIEKEQAQEFQKKIDGLKERSKENLRAVDIEDFGDWYSSESVSMKDIDEILLEGEGNENK